jgi:hypothetical protein
MFPCVSFRRSTILRTFARRRAAASYLTVIGSRQLVAGNPFPPLVSLQSQSQGAPAGVFLFTRRQDAAASVGSFIRPAGVLLSAGGVRWRFFPVGACGGACAPAGVLSVRCD